MMTMTISKKHKIVLLVACIIAAGSTFFLLVLKPAPQKGIYYNVFKTGNGYGYDVLMNGQIIIHQPFVPGKSGINGFKTEDEAGADAESVIELIKSGEHPLIGQKKEQRPGVLPAQ
jgi:hypothetical protein